MHMAIHQHVLSLVVTGHDVRELVGTSVPSNLQIDRPLLFELRAMAFPHGIEVFRWWEAVDVLQLGHLNGSYLWSSLLLPSESHGHKSSKNEHSSILSKLLRRNAWTFKYECGKFMVKSCKYPLSHHKVLWLHDLMLYKGIATSMPSFSVHDDKWSSLDCLSLASSRRVLTMDEQQAHEFTSRTCWCKWSCSSPTAHVIITLPEWYKPKWWMVDNLNHLVQHQMFDFYPLRLGGVYIPCMRAQPCMRASMSPCSQQHVWQNNGQSSMSHYQPFPQLGFATSTKNIGEKRVCIETLSKDIVSKQTGSVQRGFSNSIPTVLS